MGKIRKRNTLNMSREEWLKLRKHSIGGSDAAGIIGLSKYSSPYSVWADKTNRAEDKGDNEAMRQGRDLEEYVARRWMEETGKRVHRVNAMIYNSDYPFAHADIDRAVTGERAGLECKTTKALDVKQFKTCEFPTKYYAQCVHYLAVTGWDRWYLGVLVYGTGFFTYVLERDEDEIKALMAAEAEFWENVKDDTPPLADGTEATAEALTAIYKGGEDEEIDLMPCADLLKRHTELKAQEKAVKEALTDVSNHIKDFMKDYNKGSFGAYTASWTPQERKSFDLKEFRETFPNLDLDPFYKITTSRPFKVIKKEE